MRSLMSTWMPSGLLWCWLMRLNFTKYFLMIAWTKRFCLMTAKPTWKAKCFPNVSWWLMKGKATLILALNQSCRKQGQDNFLQACHHVSQLTGDLEGLRVPVFEKQLLKRLIVEFIGSFPRLKTCTTDLSRGIFFSNYTLKIFSIKYFLVLFKRFRMTIFKKFFKFNFQEWQLSHASPLS